MILESDRFVVLLACGHWTQTRRPEDTDWPCTIHESNVPAARTNDDRPAVLSSWDIHSDAEE